MSDDRDLSDIAAHFWLEVRRRGLCDLEEGSPEWERRGRELCEDIRNSMDEEDRGQVWSEHLGTIFDRVMQEEAVRRRATASGPDPTQDQGGDRRPRSQPL